MSTRKRASIDALNALRQVNFSEEFYRGYWIKTNPFRDDMWIEKDGFPVCFVPAGKRWEYARHIIDGLN